MDAKLKRRVTELRDGLKHLQLRDHDELTPHLLELRELLQAQNVLIYNPSCDERGWDLELCSWVGDEAESRKARHLRHVRASDRDNPTFAAYDPFAVQAAQRNRALTVEGLVALEPLASQSHRQVWAAIRAGQQDQVRALICHGPRLLAWVGAVRDEPFRSEDADILQSLVEPLRARLLARRVTSAGPLYTGLLDGLIEAISEPALLLDGRGRIEAANSAGGELVERERGRGTWDALRSALGAQRAPPGFSLTQVNPPGCPSYWLVLYAASSEQRAQKVALAGRRWKLSGVRMAVLELLLIGNSNKQIALAMRCAEITIERHVTALFRASGARSRTELVTKLFELADVRVRRS